MAKNGLTQEGPLLAIMYVGIRSIVLLETTLHTVDTAFDTGNFLRNSLVGVGQSLILVV